MEQIVRPVQATPLISPAGATVSFDVEYTTDPANSGTTGLGLRLHWDSTQLTFDSLENFFRVDFVREGTPSDDTDDLDGDPDTDRFVLVAWADFGGGIWPDDPSTLPVTLYTANFRTSPDFADATTLNFTASSTAAGFELDPTPVIIQEGEVLPPAIVTIAATDDDAAEEGEDPGTFTITRTGDTTDALTVEYNLAGSAEAADYSPELTGTATIAAGTQSVDITITPVDDDELESPETVQLTIVDADDYDLGAETVATVTIADNDAPGGTQMEQIVRPVQATPLIAPPGAAVSFDVEYTTDPANSGTLGLGLRLHWDSIELTFDSLENVFEDDLFATGTPSDDTDDLDGDPNTDRLIIVSWVDITRGTWPNDPSTLPVVLYRANFTTSPDFVDATTLNFTASSTAPGFELVPTPVIIQGGLPPAIVTIAATDDDAAEEGEDPGTFTITRTGDTTDALTVEYNLAGSAEAADYSPELTGTATIAAGTQSVDITITPVDDDELESPETVQLTIVDADDYDLGAETVATVTIADNDAPPPIGGPDLTVSIADAPDQVTENNLLTYTLTVTNEGDGAATDIVVENALPFSFIATDVDGGDFTVSQTGDVVTFSGGSLEAGESAVLTIAGMAPTTGPFPIAVNNTAVVDPDNAIAESDETNNLVIEDTTVTPAPNLIEIEGTDEDDTLVGTIVSDRIDGLAGDDLLFGGEGADLLEGRQGADNLFGGQGNDILYGNEGDDILLGDDGNDTINGGLGQDFLEGGTSRDVFVLPSDAGTTDVNQADVILAYQVGIDAIGLTDGLTFSDLLLEQTQITIEFGGQNFTADSTAIINTSSNDILGVVFEVTPDRIMDDSHFVPVQDGINGGLGQDFLEGGTSRDVFVLPSDAGTTDVNQADVILAYQVGIDAIGLTDGLTFSDLLLEQTQITIEFGGQNFTADSTAIINTSSNDILGVVFEVTPDRIMDDSHFVQVGLF
ncbi:MAG: DUF11 domain-containing protein [Hormoscilla sp. GM7CHS1pb]|nr:DUF11 domain-containing protein [Hormoscilla sp. GM7CHS1pb]